MSLIVLNDFLRLIRRYEEMSEWLRVQQDAGRDKEAFAELEKLCQQEVGVPFSIVRHCSPEDISELLRQGINPAGRSLVLAELFMLESEFNRRGGDAIGQMRASLQAFCLLGEGMESLPAADRAALRPKLEKLAGELRPADADPYLQGKLRRFGF